MAAHKANPKLAAGKMQFTVSMPWDDAKMYKGAKASLYCAPVAKVVQVTLPQKPRDGPLNITLTLPTQSTQNFEISGVAIVSGPKPAPPPAPPLQPVLVPPVAQPPAPAAQPPAVARPPPMPAMPIATAIPMQSVVQSTLAQAQMVAHAAAAVARPAVVAQPVVAQPVAAQPAQSKKRGRASTPAVQKKPASKASQKRPSKQPRRNPPAAAPPVAPAVAPPAAAPNPPVASRSGRAVKAATRFGDKGELEGNARSFQSTPVPSKPVVPLAVEYSVPGFALPGNFVWATGLLGGVKQHLGFKASVVKLRTRYPRIHVRYEADRVGNTARINLPEMREAYLMSDAVAEYDGE
jgi:hypothetical protein